MRKTALFLLGLFLSFQLVFSQSVETSHLSLEDRDIVQKEGWELFFSSRSSIISYLVLPTGMLLAREIEGKYHISIEYFNSENLLLDKKTLRSPALRCASYFDYPVFSNFNNQYAIGPFFHSIYPFAIKENRIKMGKEIDTGFRIQKEEFLLNAEVINSEGGNWRLNEVYLGKNKSHVFELIFEIPEGTSKLLHRFVREEPYLSYFISYKAYSLMPFDSAFLLYSEAENRLIFYEQTGNLLKSISINELFNDFSLRKTTHLNFVEDKIRNRAYFIGFEDGQLKVFRLSGYVDALFIEELESNSKLHQSMLLQIFDSYLYAVFATESGEHLIYRKQLKQKSPTP